MTKTSLAGLVAVIVALAPLTLREAAAQSGVSAVPGASASASAAPPPAAAPTTDSSTPAASASAAPPTVPGAALAEMGAGPPLGRRLVMWDANLDAGYGRAFGDDGARRNGLLRARAGVLWVHEPWFTAIGPTYEYSNLRAATFGLQIEQMHLTSGFWAQAGGLLDTRGRPGAMAALGVSLFGVEAQVRQHDQIGSSFAVIGKVRIPISIIAFALGQRK